MEWQPISTAPKDGTVIEGKYIDKGIWYVPMKVQWNPKIKRWVQKNGIPVLVNAWKPIKNEKPGE